ncbi:MAG: NAD(P)-dependent oxidoreductase [Planctomycetes bacterium]|nr:NAD(P)-dependent oxidoreductase [Planctomycetota bacterium]
MSTVGFIGLGTMGRHMARNIMRAGHRLVFYARRAEVVTEFEQAGATRAATPAAVTEASEFVVTIVTADAQVSEVALGAGGIIEAAAAGKTLIEMSTIGPWTARQIGARLSERGMDMIDAPVSGGPWGAEAGTLAIMAGGESDVFERSRGVLSAMGKNIFHVGPLGAGQTVKLINQMIAGGTMALIAEGFVLAKAAGADLQVLADVIAASSANSSVFEARGKKFVLADRYVPGFATALMRKDVGLAVELARQNAIPVPVASAALQQYTAAIKLGHADDDFAAVTRVCEQNAGIKVVDKT